MAKQLKPLIVNQWEKCIAISPFYGFADMRNLDSRSERGQIKLNYALQALVGTAQTKAFTVDAATDVCTLSAGGSIRPYIDHSVTGRAVTLTNSGGALPTADGGNLAVDTVYFAIDVDSDSFKLARTLADALAGTAINITGAGTGTHSVVTLDPGLMKHVVYDDNNDCVYGLDHNGRLWHLNGIDWQLITGNTLTNASGNGLAIFKNYLLVFRNAKIDVWGALTTAIASRTWTNDWATMNQSAGDASTHVAITAQDDIVYFADRNSTTLMSYVGSIAQATGTFAPGTPSTYTFNNQALDVKAYVTITGFAELGKSLMIATDSKEIYPWDRTSDSFDLPIVCAEKNISHIINLNNVVYFAAGSLGNIYYTLGTTANLLFEFPAYHSNPPTQATTIITALAAHKGRLFLGVSRVGASAVWSYDLADKSLVCENTLSIGTYGTLNGHIVGPILSLDSEDYLVAWKDVDNTTYGVDALYRGSYVRCASGYVESAIYPTGTKYSKRPFSKLFLDFSLPLASGQSVKVSFRTTLTANWTEIATFSYASYAAVSSIEKQYSIIADKIQFRLDFVSAGIDALTPEVMTLAML